MGNKASILAVIQDHPGIGVAELANALGMLKTNARRDALQLVQKGLLTVRKSELGYSFFPANWNARPLDNSRTHDPPLVFMDHADLNTYSEGGRTSRVRHNMTGAVIDGQFKDVTDPPYPGSHTSGRPEARVLTSSPLGPSRQSVGLPRRGSRLGTSSPVLCRLRPEGRRLHCTEPVTPPTTGCPPHWRQKSGRRDRRSAEQSPGKSSRQ